MAVGGVRADIAEARVEYFEGLGSCKCPVDRIVKELI
jgi:hypothetical protein